MRLLTFNKDQQYKLGIHLDRGVLDVSAAAERLSMDGMPRTVEEAVQGGQPTVRRLEMLAESAVSLSEAEDCWLLESDLQLGPCVPNPGKIICVGLNYRKHAEETNLPIPDYPILFNKFKNALSAHGDNIVLPRGAQQVDYEAELAIVIGKRTKEVSKKDALHHVYGYCIANDVSARDWQLRTPQWMLGKTCDGFSPIGPYLVTADEVGNPNHLRIRSIVNGEVRQNSSTSDMIFHCDEIVSYISHHFTLEPGDLILTGTPEGVVMGYPPEMQVYMKDGDMVTIEIQKLGSLTNRFVEVR